MPINMMTAPCSPQEMQGRQMRLDPLKPISLLTLVERLAPTLQKQVLFTVDSLKASAKLNENGYKSAILASEDINRETPFLEAQQYVNMVSQVVAVATVVILPLGVALGGIPEIAELGSVALQTANTIVQTSESALNAVTGLSQAVTSTSVGVIQQKMTNAQAASSNFIQNSKNDAKLMRQASKANESAASGLSEFITYEGRAERAFRA
jgi:hypothetical protein